MEDKRTSENTEDIQETKATEAMRQGDADTAAATDHEDAPPADGKRAWSTGKKAAVGIVAAALIAGLGIGCWHAYSAGQGQTAAQEQAQKDGEEDAAKADAEKLAKEPRPVAVAIEADGWKPENGAFTLVVKGADGEEAAKLAVMPDGNGGMDAKDAIEALPEDQFDAAKESYTEDGEDGVAKSPVLKLAPGDYTAELADMPTLEGGSTYKLPDAAAFKVEPMEKKGDESIAAKIRFSLEKIDPEDEEAVEAAIEALPEDQREAARQQYQKKAEQKQQAASNGGSTANSGGNGGGSTAGGGNGGSSSGGGSGSGSDGGGSSEPEPPAHTHVYDIPITDSVWQDGEGYQRITRIVCTACQKSFGSLDAFYAHSDEMWAQGQDHGGYLDDSYDSWTKAPGYYDVVVGYKCSCGAVR